LGIARVAATEAVLVEIGTKVVAKEVEFVVMLVEQAPIAIKVDSINVVFQKIGQKMVEIIVDVHRFRRFASPRTEMV